MIKKAVIFLFLVLALTNLNSYAFAKLDLEILDKFETAKMNLVIGETKLAQMQFKDIEKYLEEKKSQNQDEKDLYSNVMFNLGLTYEQKYFDESQKETLEGASTDDLLKANNYFEKADPNIFEEIAEIGDIKGGASETRAVGGIVGNVIKKKVKSWLSSKQNCDCSFTQSELNIAGKTFITLTEKTDIPALKKINTRDKKIAEIFSRITNYISKLGTANPTKALFDNKIKPSCKI